MEGGVDWVLVCVTDAKQSRIQPDRQRRKVLTVVRQADGTVRPMTYRHLTYCAGAEQGEPQPELRSKVPRRDTQSVRAGFCRQSESDKSLYRTSFEHLPAA